MIRFHLNVAIALVVCLCFQASTEVQAFAQTESALQQSTEIEETVERLIEKLGSKVFGERQQAVEDLWVMGRTIEPQLRKAAKNAKGDVKHRLNEILRLFEMGLDRDLDPKHAQLMIMFDRGDAAVRTHVMDQLYDSDDYGLMFELIERIKDKNERREMYDNYISYGDVLGQLASADRWDQFYKVVESSLPWEINNERQVSVYHLLISGKISERVVGIQLDVAEKQASDEQIIQLIQLLKVQDDNAGVRAYAKKISDKNIRDTLLQESDFHSGKFDLLTKNVSDESTKLSRKLIKAFLDGDLKNVNALTEKVVVRLEELGRPKTQDEFKKFEEFNLLVNSLFIVLKFDSAMKFSNLPPMRKFNLYVRFGRYADAFKELGLSEDVEKRMAWFGRKMRSLKALDVRYFRDENPAVGTESDELFTELETVAEFLGTLGYREEASYYLRTLANSVEYKIEDSTERRSRMVVQLVELADYKTFWEVVATRFSHEEDEYWNLTDDMFGDKMPTADFWFKQLAASHQEVVPRLKLIARLINASVAEDTEIDIESYLFTVETDVTSESYYTSESVNYHMGMTCLFHGREKQSLSYFRRAAELGSYEAAERLADREFEAGNFESAVDFYEQAWRVNYSPYSASRAAICWDKIDQSEKALSRRVTAMAFASAHGLEYDMLQKFVDRGMVMEIILILRVMMCVSSSTGESQPYYANWLASVLRSQALKSHTLNAVNARAAATLEKQYLASIVMQRMEGYGIEDFGNLSQAIARLEAVALIAENKVEEAKGYVELCFGVRLGDSITGEQVLPFFDRASESETGTELFAKLESFFASVLINYPDSAANHNSYAWVCACTERRLDFALRHAELAVELRPNNTNYLDTLADIAFKLGQKERAILLIRRCIMLKPDYDHYQNQLRMFTANDDELAIE